MGGMGRAAAWRLQDQTSRSFRALGASRHPRQGESMTIDTGTNELLCVVKDGVALITLNRPEARNAMSPDLTAALRNQIKARGDDPAVGALLITGAGTAFCSGGDVKAMGGRGPRGQMGFEERLSDLRCHHTAPTGELFAVRKPTVAA